MSPLFFAWFVFIFQHRHDNHIVKLVVKEYHFSEASLLPEPHFRGKLQTGSVFRESPPFRTVEIQLLKRLFKKQSSGLGTVAFVPGLLLAESQANIGTSHSPCPLVNPNRSPTHRLTRRFLLNNVGSPSRIFPLQLLLKFDT